MLDPRQDRALQDLARSIARSVDALGGSCTARLLRSIALGLSDSPQSYQTPETEHPTDDPVMRSASTQPSRTRLHQHTASHQDIYPRHRRIRP